MMDWGNGGWSGSGGNWAAMSMMMILFWGVLIALAVWVVRVLPGRGSSRAANHADALLAERFARGEIDQEEFVRSRELLHPEGSSPSRSER